MKLKKKCLIFLQFKQLMLKFDPDDPDDDEPNGAPPKVTVKLGGDDVRPSEPSDGGGDRGVPDKSRQNTQHEEQKVRKQFIILHVVIIIKSPFLESGCLVGLWFLVFTK